MELILANHKIILGIVAIIVVMAFVIYKFFTQPTSKQKEQIRAVLLNLVTYAEAQFGSSTGKLKFSYVYSELITKLPYLRFIPMSIIEQLIEDVLDEMRHLLATNPKVAKIVNKEGEK